ncbi:hypothetical protein R3W88_011284 [Solanum pinnatisectum]|uniref:Uncharacterized protein n=1 Tax=Solanum pinnatisectum TaxID=50273 RepID=A0AAV9L629_9SOLN|nr:hypothetical protein R3W88_011284 [Solanum pinnatisectum]
MSIQSDLNISYSSRYSYTPIKIRSLYIYYRHLDKHLFHFKLLRVLDMEDCSITSKITGDLICSRKLTVSGLSPSCCTKEIFEGIKKVKKLAICGRKEEYPTNLKWIDNLKYLQDLESPSIATKGMLYTMAKTRFFSLTSPDYFPQKLKKLKLSFTCLPWEYMSIISKLPKLEVLKLKGGALLGDEWKATGSQDHFPSLERVNITDCNLLKEIPQGFADSKTLELIELHKCDPSLVAFAEKIQEKHEDCGRNKLKVTAFDSGKYIYLSTYYI